MKEVSGETLNAMRRLFPSLPDRITHLTITLTPVSPPVIECRWLVPGIGCVSAVEEKETFTVDEVPSP